MLRYFCGSVYKKNKVEAITIQIFGIFYPNYKIFYQIFLIICIVMSYDVIILSFHKNIRISSVYIHLYNPGIPDPVITGSGQYALSNLFQQIFSFLHSDWISTVFIGIYLFYLKIYDTKKIDWKLISRVMITWS